MFKNLANVAAFLVQYPLIFLFAPLYILIYFTISVIALRRVTIWLTFFVLGYDFVELVKKVCFLVFAHIKQMIFVMDVLALNYLQAMLMHDVITR